MLLGIEAAYEAIVLAVVVLALVVLLGLIVLLYRRRFMSSRRERTHSFTLADIRRMHRQGQLTDEEYESMRQAVIGMGATSGDDG